MATTTTTTTPHSPPPPSSSSTTSLTKLRQLLFSLESLRLDYLQSSIGCLPLPSTHQLEALARLRPSSCDACPRGIIPTWSRLQTEVFGQVFMERVWEVCQEQGLPMDVYRKKSIDSSTNSSSNNHHPPTTTQEELVHLTTRFNQGGGNAHTHMTELTSTYGGGDEATFLRKLLEAEERGLQVNWARIKFHCPPLFDAVYIAAEVIRHLEKRPGGGGGGGQEQQQQEQQQQIDPLSSRFPMECLRQLLPEWQPVQILTAAIYVRLYRRQHEQLQPQLQQKQQMQAKPLPPPAAAAAAAGTKRPRPEETHTHTHTQVAPPASPRQPLSPLPQNTIISQTPVGVPAYQPNKNKNTNTNTATAPPSQPPPQPQPSAPTPAAPASAPAPAPQAAPVCVPLETQILSTLQAHAATGLTSAECLQQLLCTHTHIHAHKTATTHAAVDACLLALEESYVAYRDPEGKFKLL